MAAKAGGGLPRLGLREPPFGRSAPLRPSRSQHPHPLEPIIRAHSTMKHWLWLSLAIILVDQASKWLVMVSLSPYQVIELLPNLNLTLMFNEGAAFSFLSDAGGWQRWLFAGFAVLVTLVLLGWLLRLRPDERLLGLGLALIVGGAVGNLIDRLLLGHVIDFVQVYLPFIPLDMFNPWPAFNVADSAISIGVVLLLIETFHSQRVPQPSSE
jgi:signal peptidase II